MDKLQGPAGSASSKDKGNGRPTSSKPVGKAPAKASGLAEAVAPSDAPAPADLIVAARLSLSEVHTSDFHLLCVRQSLKLRTRESMPAYRHQAQCHPCIAMHVALEECPFRHLCWRNKREVL